MNQEEHVSMARELARRADEETRGRRQRDGCRRTLVGTFAHCLFTVALKAGLPHDSHGAFRKIARRMDAAQGSNRWRSRFGSAEQLHFHFYHGDLPDDELRTHKRRTAEAARELLRVL